MICFMGDKVLSVLRLRSEICALAVLELKTHQSVVIANCYRASVTYYYKQANKPNPNHQTLSEILSQALNKVLYFIYRLRLINPYPPCFESVTISSSISAWCIESARWTICQVSKRFLLVSFSKTEFCFPISG